jgi:tungstate transport system substrate-binding protein
MVHAKSLEEKFVRNGFGTKRIPFMYNDFVIVGPVADPAGIEGLKSAAEALKMIAAKTLPFISRVTDSEQWKAAQGK